MITKCFQPKNDIENNARYDEAENFKMRHFKFQYFFQWNTWEDLIKKLGTQFNILYFKLITSTAVISIDDYESKTLLWFSNSETQRNINIQFYKNVLSPSCFFEAENIYWLTEMHNLSEVLETGYFKIIVH